MRTLSLMKLLFRDKSLSDLLQESPTCLPRESGDLEAVENKGSRLRGKCSFELFRAFATGLLFFFFFLCGTAQAQTITETQQLDFGTIVVLDINNVSQVTVNSNGSSSNNGFTYIVDVPQRGEYDITGGPANSAYTLTFPPSITLIGPCGGFTIDNFETVASGALMTDGVGYDTFFLGARARSAGTGVGYPDGNYANTLDITVVF